MDEELLKIFSVDRWTVRIVPNGGKYGLGDCLVNEGGTLVEFHDRYYVGKFPPLGQFVSRYYLQTILNRQGALCLDGFNPEVWTVPAEAMFVIQTWLVFWERQYEPGNL